MKNNKKINGGIYLILDPTIKRNKLLYKLEQALDGNINVIQIWNNWPIVPDKNNLITAICKIAAPYDVPVLINNDWQLLNELPLDGVHFDNIPADYSTIESTIVRPFIAGLTVNNNLALLHWAIANKINYISFCSMFPSNSVNTCETVDHQSVAYARALTDLPIFLSGGINLINMVQLKNIDFDGIAVISGILGADDSKNAALDYHSSLKKLKQKTNENNIIK